jgi:hypothetical protein
MVLSDHDTKSHLKGTFELCLTKNIFSQKMNQDHVTNNVFEPQNDFASISKPFKNTIHNS